MSEGDLLGSPEDLNVNNGRRGRRTTSSSSPPRSRSQSTGSAHREALLFFERHQLFQQERSSSPQPQSIGLTSVDFETEWELQQLDSTEISSFSKTPSPAHISDVKSSTDEDRNTCCYLQETQSLLGVPNRRTSKSKSANLTLLSSSANDNQGENNPRPLCSSSNSNSSARENDAIVEDDLIRKRSIRGRSHSQPSQVFLCTTGGESSSSRKGSAGGSTKRDKYSWLEQIQFRAQYQHYRTNDYSSVVNSASSLDKATCADHDRRQTAISQIGLEPPQIYTQSCSSSSNHSLNGSQSGLSSSTNKTPATATTNSSALCWNFRKVKLPRIGFNAKSLDDILGKSRKSLANSSLVAPGEFICEDLSSDASIGRGGGIASGSSSSGRVGNIKEISGNLSEASNINNKSKNSSLTSLKIHNPFGGGISSSKQQSLGFSQSGSSSGGAAEKIIDEGVSSSTKVYKGKVRKSSGSSSTGSSSTVTSTLTSVLLRLPHFQQSTSTDSSDKKTKKKGGNKEKPSKSQSSGSLNRVACTSAKSDNYLNRFVASATCARFNVGKSVDNLSVYTTANTNNTKSSILETHNNKLTSNTKSKCNRKGNTTPVEAYSTKSDQNSEAQQQPQQRRWTAVKQKWDLKLQPNNLENTDSDNPHNKSHTQSVLFIKSQLNRISGIPTADTFSSERDFHPPQSFHNDQETQLESLTSHANSSPFHSSSSTDLSTVKPHEAGRVSFRLEPEEIIPSRDSPTISRSQSSDCKPQEIDPLLLSLENNTPVEEEESEEMTKSRHFHYRDPTAGGSGNSNNSSKHHRNKEHLTENTPNKASAMTATIKSTKPKAQLVVANVSYLQRPTSPCLMLSDPQSQQQSTSPIVFNNNNNYPATTNPHVQQQLITSPISPISILRKPEETSAAYHSRMKQEYLGGGSSCSSGAAGVSNFNSFNLNEPRENIENINKTSSKSAGSGYSSFVPCYNRNDVVSPTRDLTTTGMTGAKSNYPKSSLYGDGRVEFHQDPRHDDISISTTSYKDNRSNKNVNPLGGSASSSSHHHHPGGSGPTDSADQSSRFHQRELPLSPKNMNAFSADADSEILTRYGYEAVDSQQRDYQKSSQSSGNQEGVESSRRTNNNFQSIESTEEEEEMGDLQSPTYVKRTANMFNSRYSTQHNGSSGSSVTDSHNPSYLNVSRSVSGYSCISYNNGITNGSSVTTSSTANGSPYSKKFITKPATVRTEFTVRVNQQTPPQRCDSTDGEGDRDSEISEDRLIKSPSSNKTRYLESSKIIDETDSSYVPSHGKSFIMQRIERLYGSDAVSSSGVFTRKSVGSTGGVTTTTVKYETTLQQSPKRGTERIIPIAVESDENQTTYTNSVAKEHIQKAPFERILRGDEILKNDGDSNNPSSPTNMKSSAKKHNYNKNPPVEGVYEGISLELCPGTHRLQTICLDEDEKQQLVRSNGDSTVNSKTSPHRQQEKYLNGNYTNGNGPSPRNKDTKNDSGIQEEDTDKDDMMIMGMRTTSESDESDNLNRYANVAKPSLKSPSTSPSSVASKYNTRSSLTADDSGIIDPEEESTELSSQKPSASLYSYRKNSQSSSSSSAGGSPEPSGGSSPNSPSKPKLKPKPKDMALLRTLSHSPTHKGLLVDRSLGSLGSSSESQNKTAASGYSNISLEKIIGPNSRLDTTTDGDRTDSDKKLSDIRNILSVSAAGIKETSKESNLDTTTQVIGLEENQKNKENDFKSTSSITTEVVKDGSYFLSEMRATRKELERLVEISSKDLETLDQQSEKAGNILSVIGKSNLLIKKKFKQFEGLCNANLQGVVEDEPETTNEDLAGFWDMVMIQIDQVYSIFKELHRKNDHQTQSTDVPDGARLKASPRKTASSSTKVSKPTPSKSQTSAAAKARDESRRQMLAERRRLMKEKAQGVGTTTQDEVLIFTPEDN